MLCLHEYLYSEYNESIVSIIKQNYVLYIYIYIYIYNPAIHINHIVKLICVSTLNIFNVETWLNVISTMQHSMTSIVPTADTKYIYIYI